MNRTNGSILIVEDDADDRYFISRAFEESKVPARVEMVSDGQSAIDYLGRTLLEKPGPDSSRPAIVLLDLNLPRKSGLEVLRWIRDTSDWKTVVVVVLTSSTSEDDMRQAYRIGANAYVIKPADPTRLDELARVVKDFWFCWNQVPPSRN